VQKNRLNGGYQKAAEQAIQVHPRNWLCQAAGCAPLTQ